MACRFTSFAATAQAAQVITCAAFVVSVNRLAKSAGLHEVSSARRLSGSLTDFASLLRQKAVAIS